MQIIQENIFIDILESDADTLTVLSTFAQNSIFGHKDYTIFHLNTNGTDKIDIEIIWRHAGQSGITTLEFK